MEEAAAGSVLGRGGRLGRHGLGGGWRVWVVVGGPNREDSNAAVGFGRTGLLHAMDRDPSTVTDLIARACPEPRP